MSASTGLPFRHAGPARRPTGFHVPHLHPASTPLALHRLTRRPGPEQRAEPADGLCRRRRRAARRGGPALIARQGRRRHPRGGAVGPTRRAPPGQGVGHEARGCGGCCGRETRGRFGARRRRRTLPFGGREIIPCCQPLLSRLNSWAGRLGTPLETAPLALCNSL